MQLGTLTQNILPSVYTKLTKIPSVFIPVLETNVRKLETEGKTWRR